VAVGLTAASIYVAVLATSGRVGAIDLVLAGAILIAVVFLALPGKVLGWGRAVRVGLAWNAVLLGITCTETARTCPYGIHGCHSHGNPLLAIGVWVAGNFLIGAGFLTLRALRHRDAEL
jgi:hypothetical protein